MGTLARGSSEDEAGPHARIALTSRKRVRPGHPHQADGVR